MSSFVYISDTHIGTEPIGYYQQPLYRERLKELLQALNLWITETGGVDYIIHGGDMVDSCSKENILLAKEMFSTFDVPVKLCLGNHDLTIKESAELWTKEAPDFFESNSPYYTLATPSYELHVFPNNCDKSNLYWGAQQNANFAESEIVSINSKLDDSKTESQILLTHSSVFGLPPGQTGLNEPFHPGKELFRNQITSLADSHDTLNMVLSGHTHMNMNIEHNKTRYITVSSFIEAPFEFKYFKLVDNAWTMQTISLSNYINFKFDYDFNKTYVQGRPIDREL